MGIYQTSPAGPHNSSFGDHTMNRSFRKLAIFAGLALIVPAAGACRDEVSAPPGDILAQDSTLSLEVYSANQDSSIPTQTGADTPVTAPDSAPRAGIPAATIAVAPAPAEPAATPAPRRASASPIRAREANAQARRRTSTRTVASRTRRSSRVSTTERATRRTASTRQRSSATRASATTGTSSTSRSGPIGGAVGGNSAGRRVAMRATATLPVGSELSLESGQRICSSGLNVGDEFSAVLAEGVVGPLGTVIPQGATANGEIVSLANNSKANALGLHIESITIDGKKYPVSSQITYSEVDRVRKRSAGSTAARTAAGAGVGGLIGHVVGGDVASTAIGAAGGAIAGAVTAARTRSYDQCVPNGGRITAELTQPLKVQLSE